MFDAFNQGASAVTKSKTWTLDMALELMRAMAPFITPLGYQIMIAGDVLIKGSSNVSLAFVFMPFNPKTIVPKDVELLTWLGGTFGKGTDLKPHASYKHSMQFKYDGMLIDVYIG